MLGVSVRRCGLTATGINDGSKSVGRYIAFFFGHNVYMYIFWTLLRASRSGEILPRGVERSVILAKQNVRLKFSQSSSLHKLRSTRRVHAALR
jgi:hypothetical protein